MTVLSILVPSESCQFDFVPNTVCLEPIAVGTRRSDYSPNRRSVIAYLGFCRKLPQKPEFAAALPLNSELGPVEGRCIFPQPSLFCYGNHRKRGVGYRHTVSPETLQSVDFTSFGQPIRVTCQQTQ